MGRPASDATLLRAARTELKKEHALRLQIAADLAQSRAQARKAEQECAEWKMRFDLLLKRTPESNRIDIHPSAPAGDFPQVPSYKLGKKS